MKWKEHVAWIAPILATVVAFAVIYYGAQLIRRGEIRRGVLIFFAQATNNLAEPAAQPSDTKPNGPVAAAFMAGGIGSAALGLFVILSELSHGFRDFVDFSTNFGLGSGVGPL